MARKKTEKLPKSLGAAVGFKNLFSNEKIDFLLGIVFLLLSFYILIAMVSYLNTGDLDQSILEELRPGDWLNTDHAFANYCKSGGAIISYFLMAVNFGFAAFMIPAFTLLLGLHLIGAYKIHLLKTFFGMTLTMIWCSVTFARFLTPLMGKWVFNPGGGHGLYCTEQLENVIGTPGLIAILVFVALAFLTYLSAETIIIIRKAINPVRYLTNRIKFTVVNTYQPQPQTQSQDKNSSLDQQDISTEKKEQDIQITNIRYDEEDQLSLQNGLNEAENIKESNTNETESRNTGDTFVSTIDQIRQQNEKTQPETEPNGNPLTIEVPEFEKADKNKSLTLDERLDTPINPKEPFLNYKYPTLDLLKKYQEGEKPFVDMEEIKSNNKRIVEVLNSFQVEIKEIKATVGPTITLYEITPAEGVRINRIRNLEDDIALSLAALGIRIIAPIPGKGTIGIEVPNNNPTIVSMESILNSKKFQETKMELPIALGKTITNEVFTVDLAKIPHLLVAGATGQGKSVGLNAIITSLLYKKHPNELKLVLIDPKKVEFSIYAPITDHFLAKIPDDDEEAIITDVTKVVKTLNSLCRLMDSRYDLLKIAGARNIKEYNAKFINRQLNPEKGHEYMPYIVVIIDEFGDLIMTAGKEIELPIARIAQLARAVGIHMIIATQRPTTSIITGNIKANFPGRIAFKVSAMIDSRTILDRPGANQLIGRGDMLFLNGNEPVRVQCAFVDTPEVENINKYIERQPGPVMPMELPDPIVEDGMSAGGNADVRNLDPYFEEAARSVVLSQQGSTSMIQRKFSIGYNRAGRLMDQLEAAGIVGAVQGSKGREVLISDENTLNTLLAQIRNSI